MPTALRQNLVADTLSHLTIGPSVRTELLEMVPLLSSNGQAPPEPGYDLAGPAFGAGTLRVTEVSEGGTVPFLQVENAGPRPVLLLDGEELIGAKQNRVLNVTVLVAAKTVTKVPVSCVEAGRWAYRARAFKDAEWLMASEGRARKMRRVDESLRRGSKAGDQGDVWNYVAEKAARMDAPSDTSAHAALYEKHRQSMAREIARLEPVEHQVGAVFAARGRITGLELFDSPQPLRTMFPKLVRSHAADALDRRLDLPHVAKDTAEFLAMVSALAERQVDGVGLGKEVRLEGAVLVGSGLAVEDRLVHLSVLVG